MFSLLPFVLISFQTCEVIFTEEFDYGWKNRWVEGHYYDKEGTQGKWGWKLPKHYAKKEIDHVLYTTEEKKNYHISADLGRTFSNEGKDLIIAYTYKNEGEWAVQSAYLKLFPDGIDQTMLNRDTPWYLMFGADFNGRGNDMLRTVFRYRNMNFEMRSNHAVPHNEEPHLHTLIIHPDWTYEIHLDDILERKGNLEDEFDHIRPRLIPDPNAKKPDWWCDEPEIYDPTERKPADWDQPMVIDDPTDVKPDDWNSTTQGEWKPRRIPNPKYKGTWFPRIIPNPEYRGEWEPPMITNPDFEKEKPTYAFQKIRYIGFDLYQQECGSMFDKIFVGTDIAEYRAYLQVTWFPYKRAEKQGAEDDKKTEREKKKEERAKSQYKNKKDEVKQKEEKLKKLSEREMEEDDDDDDDQFDDDDEYDYDDDEDDDDDDDEIVQTPKSKQTSSKSTSKSTKKR